MRYCANLGHLQDDECGLVYMRARYYEPTTGRFICQDAAMDGFNWYAYCSNDPVCGSDRDGRSAVPDFLIGIIMLVVGLILYCGAEILAPLTGKIHGGQLASILRIKGLSAVNAESFSSDLEKLISANNRSKAIEGLGGARRAAGTGLMVAGAPKAILAIFGYAMICQALLMDIDNTSDPRLLRYGSRLEMDPIAISITLLLVLRVGVFLIDRYQLLDKSGMVFMDRFYLILGSEAVIAAVGFLLAHRSSGLIVLSVLLLVNLMAHLIIVRWNVDSVAKLAESPVQDRLSFLQRTVSASYWFTVIRMLDLFVYIFVGYGS